MQLSPHVADEFSKTILRDLALHDGTSDHESWGSDKAEQLNKRFGPLQGGRDFWPRHRPLKLGS